MNARMRKKRLKKYALDFCDMVFNDHFKNRLIPFNNRIPKIIFYQEMGAIPSEKFPEGIRNVSVETPERLTEIAGEYYNNTVYIYGFSKRSLEEVKETIRHECLHFLLMGNGLPGKDEDELFLLLATEYDATPYYLIEKGIV